MSVFALLVLALLARSTGALVLGLLVLAPFAVATSVDPQSTVLAALILAIALVGWLLVTLDALSYLVWPLLRRTTIAAGWVRTSYYLAHGARPAWARDPAGGPLVAAALALLHRRAHDPELAAWLEGKIQQQARAGLGGVVASGLLAACRGDAVTARDLLLGADAFDPDHAPPAARKIANEWLVADAAARGDWPTVIRRGVAPVQATPYTRFLARAAARIRGEALPGEPNPSDVGLWISWLLAPGRKVLRPLLDQARAAPRVLHPPKPAPPPPAPPPVDPAAHAGDPVAYAQALHATWLIAPELEHRLSATRMQELCRAWEAAWPQARRRLVQRAQALATHGSPDAALAAIQKHVARQLAALARAARLPLHTFEPDVPTAAAAAAELRAELLAGVERGCEELRQRTDADRRLPIADESRAWAQFRRLYEEAVELGGMELRYLLFPQVHRDVCGYAVWLWNDRKERGLSGPMFHWLLHEAEAVGDVEAIELQRKNVRVK